MAQSYPLVVPVSHQVCQHNKSSAFVAASPLVVPTWLLVQQPESYATVQGQIRTDQSRDRGRVGCSSRGCHKPLSQARHAISRLLRAMPAKEVCSPIGDHEAKKTSKIFHFFLFPAGLNPSQCPEYSRCCCFRKNNKEPCNLHMFLWTRVHFVRVMNSFEKNRKSPPIPAPRPFNRQHWNI